MKTEEDKENNAKIGGSLGESIPEEVRFDAIDHIINNYVDNIRCKLYQNHYVYLSKKCIFLFILDNESFRKYFT